MCPQGCGGSSPPFGTSYLAATSTSRSTFALILCVDGATDALRVVAISVSFARPSTPCSPPIVLGRYRGCVCTLPRDLLDLPLRRVEQGATQAARTSSRGCCGMSRAARTWASIASHEAARQRWESNRLPGIRLGLNGRRCQLAHARLQGRRTRAPASSAPRPPPADRLVHQSLLYDPVPED